MGLFDGKTALIFGVANKGSIAWGIAQALAGEGARLGFSYAAPELERRVRPLAESVGAELIEQCDVTDDEAMDRLFEAVGRVLICSSGLRIILNSPVCVEKTGHVLDDGTGTRRRPHTRSSPTAEDRTLPARGNAGKAQRCGKGWATGSCRQLARTDARGPSPLRPASCGSPRRGTTASRPPPSRCARS